MYKNDTLNEHYKIELYLNTGMKQFEELNKLDKSFIGTNDYMGLAYFWDHDIKYWLRDASKYQRVKVHKLFMLNNVPMLKCKISNSYYFKTNKLAHKICLDIFETNKQQKVA